ncbi:putative phosphatase 2C 15 isoform X1 [Micractinium conductrix]|uniref:Phosphatase 2C 15 isoform X1 n=1 Tax=Micractinium conductrix TaxID=554055 RepID=A0A2P6VRJ2_9CHLO|nr:putative phosphatase 2C 15 isoform X1 [Micractinium conductrix]|eukprot:PSC76687.1 putative phosphatase 2C 15 isoform X1 [Micractinium conductrix]
MSVVDGLGPGACCHPEVLYNSAASILKDEDVLLVEHQRPWPGAGGGGEPSIAEHSTASGGSARCSCCGSNTDEYSVFAVFDGHNGVAAARLAADSLLAVMEPRLPHGPPPSPQSPGFLPWREDVQLALVETLAELNKMFAMKGILAGCTATLVLQVGWLLTCANLGDSRALLDIGLESHMLTVDHRVATHKGERRRVEAMGNTIAPIDFSGSGPASRVDNGVGPLRIWPGGLCLSRAIGDFDVGDAVIPFPHVMQVMVPPTGGRMLVASDGVWDAYEKMTRMNSMLRSWTLDSSPQRLIQSIVRAYGGLRDDTSLVIADILPPGGKSFPECATAVAQRAKAAGQAASAGGGGGGCGCFGCAPSSPTPVAAPVAPVQAAQPVAALEVLADVDVAAVMGLMPGSNQAVPGWYDEYVGEHLFTLAADAMEGWREAHERRTGRRPATPPLESSVRAARAAKAALAGEREALIDSEGAAWAPAPGGGMPRTASMFFAGAVAEGEGDYAERFGHYKGVTPESLASGSPGNSMHLAASLGTSPGGSAHSTRSGGYRYADASVRAANRFAGDASVRAGGAYLAGSANGGSGAQRTFRQDPSIRQGTAYFAGSGAPRQKDNPSIQQGGISDSAGSAGSGGTAGMLATSMAGEEAGSSGAAESPVEEGRQRGGRGAASAALAAAFGQDDGAPKNGRAAPENSSSSGSAATSAPIPVPRSVAFGAVTVLGGASLVKPPAGGADALADSPMDHTSLLRQQSSGNSNAVGMESIAEA